jgi:hypothetical protein
MYYVYHLVDPRSDEVFYVGKGVRNRIADHEREAKKGGDHQKCEVIRSIWEDGLKVVRRKVRHFESEQEAFDFEAKEIARIGRSRLTNICPGGGRARETPATATEPIYVARLLLKYLGRVLRLKGAGYRLNEPWQEVVDKVLPTTISRLLEKFGREFVSSELKKHGIEAVYG